jgi:muramoyltetrapeptide carboxypeptidase
MIRPAPLKPGDALSVIAPSGPVPRARFEAGAKILGTRYRLVHDERIFERAGLFAGTDAARLAELEAAFASPATKGVIVARGGYGLTRLVARITPERLRSAAKPIIGFSDVTALHGAAARQGLVTIHGPVVTQLGDLDVTDIEALYALLEEPAAPPPFIRLETLTPGAAEGPVLGGNLEVLTRLIGTPHLPALAGAILFIEEVGERPYRIDRQLTHLRASGALDGLKGIVCGTFDKCDPPEPDGPTALDAVLDCATTLKVPAVAGFPAGHADRNRAFPLGARARLDAHDGRLEFLEGAVA